MCIILSVLRVNLTSYMCAYFKYVVHLHFATTDLVVVVVVVVCLKLLLLFSEMIGGTLSNDT